MPFYSSNGVDEYIEQHLPEVGLAVDVGANDGVFFSNSLHLEEKGWTVLCIEPNPLLIKRGRSRRRLWRQVACGARDETGVIYVRGDPSHWADGSSTLVEGPGLYEPAHEFPVQILRLDRVLEEAGFHKLDLLTVDAELNEPQIMEGFTVERWKPGIIVLENIENNEFEIPKYCKIMRLEYDNIYQRLVP